MGRNGAGADRLVLSTEAAARCPRRILCLPRGGELARSFRHSDRNSARPLRDSRRHSSRAAQATMASYDTIPTPAPEEGPKPKTLKRVLAAAALASFAFGALFATAVTTKAFRKATTGSFGGRTKTRAATTTSIRSATTSRRAGSSTSVSRTAPTTRPGATARAASPPPTTTKHRTLH